MKFSDLIKPEPILTQESVVSDQVFPEPKEERQQEAPSPLPDEFVPTTLGGLKITCERINYTVDAAESNITLLEASVGVISEDDSMSDLAMSSVISQIDTAASAMPSGTEAIIRDLTKTLTSDNPYKYEAVLEALQKTISNLKPVVLQGIKTLSTVNNFLLQNVDVKAISAELKAVQGSVTVTPRPDDKVSNGGSDLDKFDMIVKAVQSNQNPESIPAFISSRVTGESEISSTACSLIARGLTTIKLNETRDIDVSDISALGDYLAQVSTTQKAMDNTLSEIGKVLNQGNISEESVLASSDTITVANSVFWATVAKLGKRATDTDLSGIQGNFPGATRAYPIMNGWPGVFLFENGDSIHPEVTSNSNFGIIKPNLVTDITQALLGDISNKFNTIIKNSVELNIKVEQINSLITRAMGNEIVLSDAAIQKFTIGFSKVMEATKFTGNMTIGAIEAFKGVTTSVTSISRGIGILTEAT